MRYPTLEQVAYEDHFKKPVVSVHDDAYIREELGFLQYVDPQTCSPAKLISWLAHFETITKKENAAILALRAVETFMFAKASQLQEDSSGSTITSDEVRKIVRQHGKSAAQWSKKDSPGAVFDVEQRSRELLVKWIAFCLVHQRAARSYPLVQEYGIALSWMNLQFAIVRDRAALSALCETASYIRAWNESRSVKPLFDLDRQMPTLHFAGAFALSSNLYLRRYAASMRELDGRITAKWNEVERKKDKAARLRSEIYDLKASILSLQKQLDTWEPALRTRYQLSNMRNDALANLALAARTTVNDLSYQLTVKERDLEYALKMPQFVTNPLPDARDRSLEVLLLMEMPHELKLLSELCFIAQSALAEPNADYLEDKLPWPTWASHHNGNSLVTSYANAVVVPCLPDLRKPESHGPSTIDYLSTRVDFERKCIWYPPGENTQFFWCCGVNPFKITRQMKIEFFTHQLSSEFDKFRWAIEYLGGPGRETRGYLAYSKVLERYPDGFDKYSFIAFGLLRASPNQQIRKLCCAVKDDILPWSHPCVGAVVRQTMYQVGELTDAKMPVPWWKTDFQSDEGLAIFCSAIDRAADRLTPSPRNYEEVPILSELAAYTCQWMSEAQSVVAKFVNMCRRWASGVKKQYHNNRRLSSEEVTELRALECLLFGYALQSYTLGGYGDAALFEIGELVVLFRNSILFPAESERWGALKQLEIAISETMARRIHAVVRHFEAHPKTLTLLLKRVNTGAPIGLKWSLMRPTEDDAHSSSCFEAFDAVNETHYSVNLFTGIVLTDGNSPGGLPVQIRTSEMYRELFGEHDFEVIFSKGVYQTAHRVGECYFHFMLGGDDGFRLREVYLDTDSRVEKTVVLCETTWIDTVRDQGALPHRVRAMHSMWYWVEEKCILARPKSAFEKEVAFVLTFDDQDDNAKCFAIPITDQQYPHQAILERLSDYDCIVRVSDELIRVLQKFEDEAYIHALQAPDGQLKINFPRFRLNFAQDPTSYDLRSLEYAAYVLDQEQQLEDALPNFQRYLVLRLDDETVLAKPRIRILVPLGVMIKNGEGMPDVELSSKSSADLNVTVLDIHCRLETLLTESVTVRLQLCALLASTGSNIPTQRFKMTGSEAALQVLQGCYSSHPFSDFDFRLLQSICSFGHREPALKLLASCILQKAGKFSFLMGASPQRLNCTNALTKYSAMCVRFPEQNPLRHRLSKTEEKLFLGSIVQHEKFKESSSLGVLGSIPSPVKPGFVEDVEAQLARFLVQEMRTEAPDTPLPVKQLTNSRMGREMNLELQQSWQTYHKHPDAQLTEPLPQLLPAFQRLLDGVAAARSQVLEYLFQCVHASRNDVCSRVLAMINYLPTPAITDIVRSSYDESVRSALIPHVTPAARSEFQSAVLQFMKICVLGDKLDHLVVGARQATPLSYIVDEPSSKREWSSEKYPFWLAFEVEGRLQIRHEQYVVARHLIENPGSVCQMNMGRGKTKVILPMLFLYFSHRRRGDKVVRAHFLTPLLSETRQFMHRYLSASSTLGFNFIELPFHRNVELDLYRLQLILEAMGEAKASGKFLMMAPEHRMSLELKRLDLMASAQDDDDNDPVIQALDRLLDSEQYIDVLDESDATLHHKYHLVYAVGVSQKLLCGDDRWFAVEALFRIMSSESTGSRVREVLQRPHVSFQCSEYVNRFGGYNGLRLSASVENKDEVRAELRRALALDLMDDPSFSLMWLRTFSDHGEETQEQLVQAITDPTVSLNEAIAGIDTGISRFRDRLLALRGLTAFGILEHCLEKRHRVEYGLPDPGTRKKCMVIPFRAADIPSEWSEFSHPEVGITLTILAYYHKGLDERELKEALQQLLLLGVSEQSHMYRRWYDAVKEKLSPDAVKHLPTDARQLSPKDSRQFALLFETFRFTTEAISFFLNTCVFPKDTTQYSRETLANRHERVAIHQAVHDSEMRSFLVGHSKLETVDRDSSISIAKSHDEHHDPVERAWRTREHAVLLDPEPQRVHLHDASGKNA